MSDTPDLPEIEVHPPPAEHTEGDPPPDPQPADNEEQQPHENHEEADGVEADVLPGGLDLNLAAALSAIPPEDDEMVEHHEEHGEELGHEHHEEHHEGHVPLEALDPATLADLAALSRMEDEEEGAGELVDEGQDFAALIGQAITNEEVQEFVDTFGQVQEEEEHESAAPAPVVPPPPPPQQVQPTPRRVVHTFRPESARSTDESDTERRDPDSLYYTENGKLKRRRNRTVLSCTECHRRVSRA
jgi:hypothetical protein